MGIKMKALVLIFVFFTITLGANTVSNLSGEASVNSGALNYKLPLNLPIGTAGVKPDLSLVYSSNSGNGYYGVGWNISSGSMISRCPSNIALDGVVRPVSYDEDDQLCIDGQRLVLLEGNEKLKDNSEYRTKIQSYAKIIYKDDKFKVFTKSGDIKEYKKFNDVWLLFRISDRFNNTINYNYHTDTTQTYLESISYADNKVIFNHENKKDKFIGYSHGKKINITERVKSIDIKSASKTLRTYKLKYYPQSLVTDKSILKNITECSNGECLKPVSLGVTSTKDSFKSVDFKLPDIYFSDINGSDFGARLADINGDGLTDIIQLYLEKDKYKKKVYINNGSKLIYNASYSRSLPNVYFAKKAILPSMKKNGSYGTRLADINGDGLVDIITLMSNGAYPTREVYLNTGKKFIRSTSYTQSLPDTYIDDISGQTMGTQLADINGDGLVDIIQLFYPENGAYFNQPQKRIYLNTGKKFKYNSQYSQTLKNTFFNKGTQLADINGDGLVDIIQIYLEGYVATKKILLNNGKGFFENTDYTNNLPDTYFNTGTRLADINGDGLVDIIQLYLANDGKYFNQPQKRIYLNDGTKYIKDDEYSESLEDTYFNDGIGNNLGTQLVDINGDGLIDIVQLYFPTIGHYFNQPQRRVYLNDGTHYIKSDIYSKALPDTYFNNAINSMGTQLADMNGDGLVDIVQLYDPSGSDYYGGWKQKRVFLNKNKDLYKIKTITDSFGNKTEISYAPLTDKKIYKKQHNAKSPNIDIQTPMLVVSSISKRGPNNEKLTTSYRYEGLKINREGLGSLGFAKIKTSNNFNNTKTITNYLQNYPLNGMVKDSTSYMGSEKLSQQIFKYKHLKDEDGCIQIFSTKSIEYTFQNNQKLSTTITENQKFDEYGNVGKVISTIIDNTTGEKFVTITNNTYTNDESKWILARLIKATVTKKAYQDVKTRTSSFTYSDTTGILTSETIEPNTKKWLKKSYKYDDKGNKTSESISGADINATTTKYTYDKLGKYVLEITNPLGDTLKKTYNTDGQVISIKDANGLITRYYYDNFQKKIKELRADATYTTYKYVYDSSFHSLYKIVAKTDNLPEVTTYYNKLGQATRVKKIGFDGKAIYEDRYYDKLSNVVKQSLPYYQGDDIFYIIKKYDKYNRLITEEMPTVNYQRATNRYRYDRYTTISTNAKGQIKSITKNALGKIVLVEEEEGASQSYYYDALSNLIKTEDSQGNVTTIRYDIYGNKIYQDDPDMGKWHYTYNALGKLVSQTDAKGQKTLITYDKLGRKTEEKINGVISRWVYDKEKKGLLSKESKGNFVKEYKYDKYLRVTSITTTIDKKKYIKRYSYDKHSRVDTKTLPNNFKIKNVYNKYGYLEAVKSPKKQIKDFDADHFVTLIEQTLKHAIENHKKALEYQHKASKLYIKTKRYEYIVKKLKAKDGDKEELKKIIKRLKVQAKKYEYYAKKYKRYSNYYKKVSDRYMSLSQTYSFSGWLSYHFKRLSIIYKWYSNRYAYYSNYYLNKAKEQIRAIKNYEYKVKKLNHYINLAKQTLNKAKQATEVAKEFEQKAQQSYAINKAYKQMQDDSTYNYFYKVLKQDSFNRVTSYISGNGLITNKTYTNAGYLEHITTGYDFDNGIRDLYFEYDENSNLILKEDNKLNIVQTYDYDNLNRIVYANTKGANNYNKSMSYRYDSIGNMIYKSDIGEYTYSTLKPHQVIQAGGKHFSYDKNGNMINNNGMKITYTPFNKTSKLITSKDTIEFYYDTDKNRYKKTTSKDITYYIDKEFEQNIDKKTNLKTQRYFIYVNGKVISIYTSSNKTQSTKYLHYDSLGSVDTITNNIGVVESRVAYKPFGERLELDKNGNTTTTPPQTKRGYTGHEHIEGTKLINMNARLYDPTIARFMSADSIIPDAYDTQAYNRYSYVKNNPLKYTDPSGHSWLSKAWKKATNWWHKNWRSLVTTVVSIVVSIGTMGVATPILGSSLSVVVAGAIGGATAGAVGTALNGGSFKDSIKNGLKGAVIGGISAAMAYGVAEMTGGLFGLDSTTAHEASFFESYSSGSNWGASIFKSLAHGVVRAGVARIQGQSARAGFWSGLVASAFSVGSKGFGKGMNGVVNRTAIMAVVGGTVSQLTGGKFANGAVSAAFVHLFNSEGLTLAKHLKNIWHNAVNNYKKTMDGLTFFGKNLGTTGSISAIISNKNSGQIFYKPYMSSGEWAASKFATTSMGLVDTALFRVIEPAVVGYGAFSAGVAIGSLGVASYQEIKEIFY